jgi:hypothetical protein
MGTSLKQEHPLMVAHDDILIIIRERVHAEEYELFVFLSGGEGGTNLPIFKENDPPIRT